MILVMIAYKNLRPYTQIECWHYVRQVRVFMCAC